MKKILIAITLVLFAGLLPIQHAHAADETASHCIRSSENDQDGLRFTNICDYPVQVKGYHEDTPTAPWYLSLDPGESDPVPNTSGKYVIGWAACHADHEIKDEGNYSSQYTCDPGTGEIQAGADGGSEHTGGEGHQALAQDVDASNCISASESGQDGVRFTNTCDFRVNVKGYHKDAPTRPWYLSLDPGESDPVRRTSGEYDITWATCHADHTIDDYGSYGADGYFCGGSDTQYGEAVTDSNNDTIDLASNSDGVAGKDYARECLNVYLGPESRGYRYIFVENSCDLGFELVAVGGFDGTGYISSCRFCYYNVGVDPQEVGSWNELNNISPTRWAACPIVDARGSQNLIRIGELDSFRGDDAAKKFFEADTYTCKGSDQQFDMNEIRF